VVEYQQQILLARNVEWPPGFFGLIAGYLEAKEAPEDAILRELQEEVGLAGRVIAPIGQYPYFEKNQLILAYHVEASGQIVVGPELAEIKLVPMDKLRPWAFGTGLAVRDWLTRRSNAGP
jgi:NADH pyrophosphatase NudC (nudix superfamily)